MLFKAHANDVIWRNGRIATMNTELGTAYGLLENHDLIIRGEQIIAIHPSDHVEANGCDIIDVKGRLITPGLIDCHTHLVFGGNRAAEWEQRMNGVSYETISAQGGGINSTVRSTRAMSEEALFDVSKPRLEALIHEGVTTVEMKSGYGLDLASEEKQLLVAKRLFAAYPIEVSSTLLSAHTVPPEYKGRADEYIDLICNEIMPQLWKKGLFDAVDVFCESVGFSLKQSEKLFLAAQKLGIPVKGHVEQLSNLGGSELVAQFKGLSVDHIEYLDLNGIQALKRSGTVAVLLPGAFYFLRETKLPPIDLLREHQVPIAISTDFNPGTSPFASLRMVMNMAAVLFRLTPEEIWAGVTRHAAKALGREDAIGLLSAGYQANFVVWNAHDPVEMIYEQGSNPLHQRVYQGKVTHQN
ncbi:imidazolonepropionase [Providencia alcalifaciens]|uniref:Imidazolonepropionase n=1 Tax=Providencia alcalifaciens DSM 30120 TaxID=520999 RepID=B6XIW0_9GAMM|nr:imidazolonepropionase [Providencia alcalifaciens]ATG16890.1 imidazolonepropionase [Providencia alcalifaciens]EEB44497.1 imidazolonepropionase [Providencia alcalifaciens DSM 30120]MTC27694.1 imidazolonepropionase [Providencia alcalifaciens]MTC54030.1 imidazolonepropionase [Providencia alcalifaciens]SPY73862.1 Imidazolonepropionase [Providencia alcalifaciens]